MNDERAWEWPESGDVLTMRDGRTRTVCGTDTIGGRVDYLQYVYADRRGVDRHVDCRASTWRATCSVETKRGGSYRRRLPATLERGA